MFLLLLHSLLDAPFPSYCPMLFLLLNSLLTAPYSSCCSFLLLLLHTPPAAHYLSYCPMGLELQYYLCIWQMLYSNITSSFFQLTESKFGQYQTQSNTCNSSIKSSENSSSDLLVLLEIQGSQSRTRQKLFKIML
ncbi:MAG: hypothetical protein MHMPM18_001265 [Marteilia pararefringens]